MKRTIALITIPPVLVTVAVIAVLLAIAPSLPPELATHWGVGGVDGTGTLRDLIVPAAITSPVIAAALVTILLAASRRGSSTALERSSIAISVFAGSSVALSMLAVAIPQQGITDVSEVAGVAPAPWVAGAFALGLVLAAGCALLSRPVAAKRRPLTGAPVIPLTAGERAVWTGSVTAPIGIQVLVLVAGSLVVILLWFAGAAWIALPEALIFAFVISTLHWRVTVTRTGIVVRSAFGVPRFRVAIEEVTEARAIPISPVRQFGGWGIRVGATGWGVILQPGDAIEVSRVGRSALFVTIDDAETGAALLNTFANETRKRPPHPERPLRSQLGD